MMTQFLMPPEDGRRNAVIVNGRLYESMPGVAIVVPTFDVPTLEANGWTDGAGALPPATTSTYASGAVSGVVQTPKGSSAGVGVRLYIDGAATPAGVTIADATGAWSIPTGTLTPGPHRFSVEIDESAGSFTVTAPAGVVNLDFSNPLNSGLIAALAA